MISPLVKIWVDDTRTAPGGWYWAKNVAQAINLFTTERVAIASLDHDLGAIWGIGGLDLTRYDTDAPTGSDLIDWIADNEKWPMISLSVHSANPLGARYMRRVISKRGPYNSHKNFNYELDAISGRVEGMTFLYGKIRST